MYKKLEEKARELELELKEAVGEKMELADDDTNSMLSDGDNKTCWGSDGHNLDGDGAKG